MADVVHAIRDQVVILRRQNGEVLKKVTEEIAARKRLEDIVMKHLNLNVHAGSDIPNKHAPIHHSNWLSD